ncbi:Polyketide cyclase / dehydrase and lipid transport [Cedecea lapagei]|uniref:Polyketide cyclase / dehydrase and lipid transport n=1 Tax=Cedecea lapagei TaxID=158823 RepID=A0A447V0C6_9ENTR|nr:SRPBCC family protein [Cedecea lapagei]VEB96416.1 Polyketide cyclase / dehydrase and lipid transport [Cedecea lapagei]
MNNFQVIFVSDVIDMDVDNVWQKLCAFDEFADFFPAGMRCRYLYQTPSGPGSVRRIDMPEGYVEEQLIALAEESHTLEYLMLATSLPVGNYRAKIVLKPITQGERTFIEWRASFTADHPEPAQLAEEIREHVFITAINGMKKYFHADNA